jgi:CRISPR-associated protein Csy2
MSDKNLLLLPKIKIHNANALSSPYTIGFPAMTAWLGFVHALQRKLNQQGFYELKFNSMAVVSHQFDLQTYKGDGDFVNSIVGTGNPLDKDGSRSAFIEEARVHLTVSLLIEYEGSEEELDEPEFVEKLEHLIGRMKIAGGDIQNFESPLIDFIEEHDEKGKARCLRNLMPGYVLIERRELMEESMVQGADALDAILEYLTINHSSELSENGDVTWHSQRKTAGWIVPIATGFQGISELGKAKNQRAPNTPHRFAESVVTLGEFVMPYRIKNLDDMLWHYHTDLNNNLYLCQQNNRI